MLVYTEYGTTGVTSLVKNFFTTPAIAKPLYYSNRCSSYPSFSLLNSSIISSSSSIDPDLRKMPSSYKKATFFFSVFTRIERGTGMPSLSSF